MDLDAGVVELYKLPMSILDEIILTDLNAFHCHILSDGGHGDFEYSLRCRRVCRRSPRYSLHNTSERIGIYLEPMCTTIQIIICRLLS